MSLPSSGLGRLFSAGVLLTTLAPFAGCGPTQTSDGGGGGTSGSGGSRSDGDGGDLSAGPITNLDGFFQAEQRGYCARLFRCYEADDDFMGARLVLQSQARCEQLLARVNATSVNQRDLRAEEAAGRLQVVPERALRCVEALATCNGPGSLDEGPCRDIIEGSAAIGEACHRSEDCEGDAYCDSGQSCPGTCVARRGDGAICASDQECAAGAGHTTCLFDDDGNGACHTFEAQPKAGLGEPCTRRLSGASALILCDDALWCATVQGGEPNSDVMGACSKPLAPGDPCVDSDDVCSTGFCDTAAQQCVSASVTRAAGDSCGEASKIFCDPLAGLTCKSDTCAASGDGSEGSGCYTSDLQLGCEPGLYCDKPAMAPSDELGVCRPLLADGSACDYPQDCKSGSCEQNVCGGRRCLR